MRYLEVWSLQKAIWRSAALLLNFLEQYGHKILVDIVALWTMLTCVLKLPSFNSRDYRFGISPFLFWFEPYSAVVLCVLVVCYSWASWSVAACVSIYASYSIDSSIFMLLCLCFLFETCASFGASTLLFCWLSLLLLNAPATARKERWLFMLFSL